MASFDKAKKSYQRFHKERGQVKIHCFREYILTSDNDAYYSIALNILKIVVKQFYKKKFVIVKFLITRASEGNKI